MDELCAGWWAKWWSEDYSWTALDDRYVIASDPGCRAVSLADYWRRTPDGRMRTDDELRTVGELPPKGTPTEEVFHIAHLPPRLRSGKPTWKNDPDHKRWSTLRSLMADRILVAKDTPGTPGKRVVEGGFERFWWTPNKRECRAVLDGSVLDAMPDVPEDITLDVAGRRVAFTRQVAFRSVKFGRGFSLEDSLFLGGASAIGCSNAGAVLLAGNIYVGPFSLHRSIFESALYCAFSHYCDRFDATNLQCRHEGNLERSTFHRAAEFRNARFALAATLTGCHFKEGADFDNVMFQDRLAFNKVVIDGPLTFSASTIDKVSAFDDLQLSFSHPEYWHGAFDRTTFGASTDFRRLDLRFLAAFDGARIQSGERFDEISETDTRKAIAAAIAVAEQTARTDVSRSEVPVEQRDLLFATRRNIRLRQLENGCRALKQLRSQSDHRFEAMLLTRFELTVRRTQSDVGRAERVVSWIYAATSGYGMSLRRPVAWLAGLMVSMAIVFSVIISCEALGSGLANVRLDGAKATEAATLSLGNVFVPFGSWTSKVLPKDFSSLNDYAIFAVRVLSTVESLAAVLLLFLLGLAIRKRFHVQ